MFSGVGRSPSSHHVCQLLGSWPEEMCNHSGADSAALNRSHTRCLVVPFCSVLYAMSSFFSAEVDGMTGTLQPRTEVHVSRLETCAARSEDKS